jgi:tetratricopeptide (TPR) repeat protein
MYLEQGELERAYECFLSIRQSLASHPDLMMEARVESSIGIILLEVGLVDEARETCDRALSIFHNIGNQKGACEVLDTLAKIHLAKGEDQLSREYTERSMDMKRELGDKSGVLSTQLNIARIANRQARYREALEIAKEVLSGARDAHLKSLELECLVEIMQAKAQMSGPVVALAVLSSDESPDQLAGITSPSVIDFASKVGELSLLAGDERMAARYIIFSGKSIQSIIAHFENPTWREAYSGKRAKILAAYENLRSTVRTS